MLEHAKQLHLLHHVSFWDAAILAACQEANDEQDAHLLDVVALLAEQPAHDLVRGQVGIVVEILDGAYEVEFSDTRLTPASRRIVRSPIRPNVLSASDSRFGNAER